MAHEILEAPPVSSPESPRISQDPRGSTGEPYEVRGTLPKLTELAPTSGPKAHESTG